MAQPAQNIFHALDQALAAAVATAGRSVVQIARGHGHTGTGIAWADDLVISSSFHTPDRTKVGIPAAAGQPGEDLDRRDAEVIGRDPGTDVALLRVTGGGLTPAAFRDIGDLAVGNLALALGRPGRTVRASLRAIGVLGPTVRTPHGGKLDRFVESDRQIPRGFAGGPLVDADGAVIGMNTRTLLRGSDVAVPTATLRRVVAELQAHGGVRRGYLGVGAFPAQLPASVAQLVGRDRGALVANIEDGAPAATAGIQVGDVIVELAGTPITDPESLRLALGDRPGETVELVVLRGGAKQTLSVTLGSRS
ncbi:MAG: PDZ domain-containing protein [Deltaproteobacteria bacterium]|nr:MAG: PDZ domain-containing protein [Deltaproteobacteria bacterium]TMQ16022.1 MAG: PDZ domain-containing protein [Deltaproteobacteria bacterium]